MCELHLRGVVLACDAAKRNDWSAGEQWLRRAWGNSSTPDASSATGHGAGDEGWKDLEGSGRIWKDLEGSGRIWKDLEGRTTADGFLRNDQ